MFARAAVAVYVAVQTIGARRQMVSRLQFAGVKGKAERGTYAFFTRLFSLLVRREDIVLFFLRSYDLQLPHSGMDAGKASGFQHSRRDAQLQPPSPITWVQSGLCVCPIKCLNHGQDLA